MFIYLNSHELTPFFLKVWFIFQGLVIVIITNAYIQKLPTVRAKITGNFFVYSIMEINQSMQLDNEICNIVPENEQQQHHHVRLFRFPIQDKNRTESFVRIYANIFQGDVKETKQNSFEIYDETNLKNGKSKMEEFIRNSENCNCDQQRHSIYSRDSEYFSDVQSGNVIFLLGLLYFR